LKPSGFAHYAPTTAHPSDLPVTSIHFTPPSASASRALESRGGVFPNRFALWNEDHLAESARLLVKLNAS